MGRKIQKLTEEEWSELNNVSKGTTTSPTSIEWLIDQMFRQGYFDGNKPLSITNLDHLQQQAVEMHKAEIIKAFDEGQEYEYQYHINNAPKFDSETYYQETFVSNSEKPNVSGTYADLEKLRRGRSKH